MWPFDRRPPEERFWIWFQKNSDRLFTFETDQERVFGELSAALKAVKEGLVFEFGAVRDGRREFVVSADGIRELFPDVRRLVAAAPPLARWIVTPFRPPGSLGLVKYGGISLGPDDIWFTTEPDAARTGLTLFVRGLTEENLHTLSAAVFILLDRALGEFAVATQVGFIEWKPLPDEPETAGLTPFRRIRKPFDTVSH